MRSRKCSRAVLPPLLKRTWSRMVVGVSEPRPSGAVGPCCCEVPAPSRKKAPTGGRPLSDPCLADPLGVIAPVLLCCSCPRAPRGLAERPRGVRGVTAPDIASEPAERSRGVRGVRDAGARPWGKKGLRSCGAADAKGWLPPPPPPPPLSGMSERGRPSETVVCPNGLLLLGLLLLGRPGVRA